MATVNLWLLKGEKLLMYNFPLSHVYVSPNSPDHRLLLSPSLLNLLSETRSCPVLTAVARQLRDAVGQEAPWRLTTTLVLVELVCLAWKISITEFMDCEIDL